MKTTTVSPVENFLQKIVEGTNWGYDYQETHLPKCYEYKITVTSQDDSLWWIQKGNYHDRSLWWIQEEGCQDRAARTEETAIAYARQEAFATLERLKAEGKVFVNA